MPGHSLTAEPNYWLDQVRAVRDERGSGEGGGGAVLVGDGEWPLERQSRAILQLGKMGEDRFSLDFRPPLSPFQALAIAISVHER